MGPADIGGRVVDLAVDPTTSPSTVYAAVSDGRTVFAATFGRGIYRTGTP